MIKKKRLFILTIFQDGGKIFKSYKTTQETKVTLCQGSNRENTTQPPQQTSPITHQKISPNRTKCSAKQTEILKRLKNNLPKKSKKIKRAGPKGKTYRKTRHDPKEVSIEDPTVKKKLVDKQIRDSKSGGLSWSSRVRRHPDNIR